MKKARELSILCNLKINVSIFDESRASSVEFASDPSFTLRSFQGKFLHDHTGQIFSQNNAKFKHKLYTSSDLFDATGKIKQDFKELSEECSELPK